MRILFFVILKHKLWWQPNLQTSHMHISDINLQMHLIFSYRSAPQILLNPLRDEKKNQPET